MSRFAKANFEDSEAVLQLQRKTYHPVNPKLEMALGRHILKRDGGERWHWYNGGTGGFRSSMVMNLKEERAVIVLANVSATHKRTGNIDRLSDSLLRSL